MLIPLLGSVGTGLVWGWLLVQRQSRFPTVQRFRRLLALGLATGLAAMLVILLAGRAALLAFVAAAGTALIAHVTWQQALRRGPSSPHKQRG